MNRTRRVSLLIAASSLLFGACGGPPEPPTNDPLETPTTHPAVTIGPAERPDEPPAAEGLLAYYGAVVRGYVRAESRLKEAELRSCFNTGLALRFGELPAGTDDVRKVLEDGGYDFDRLPAGHVITYDPDARTVFLLKRAAD